MRAPGKGRARTAARLLVARQIARGVEAARN